MTRGKAYITIPYTMKHVITTQLANVGSPITIIQSLPSHKRFYTTMTHARVHDKTAIDDYFKASKPIVRTQKAVLGQ